MTRPPAYNEELLERCSSDEAIAVARQWEKMLPEHHVMVTPGRSDDERRIVAVRSRTPESPPAGGRPYGPGIYLGPVQLTGLHVASNRWWWRLYRWLRSRWIALALVVAATSAAAAVPHWNVSSTGSIDGLRRFIDHEAEVVCYTIQLQSIACLPIESDAMRKRLGIRGG